MLSQLYQENKVENHRKFMSVLLGFFIIFFKLNSNIHPPKYVYFNAFSMKIKNNRKIRWESFNILLERQSCYLENFLNHS